MANATAKSWIPPGESVFVVDCALSSSWAVSLVHTHHNDFLLKSTYTLLDDALRQYWKDKDVNRPEMGEMMRWFMEDGYLSLDFMWNFTLTNCKELFCAELGWQGNSDLAGLGVRPHRLSKEV
jgi:hypothetical protein